MMGKKESCKFCIANKTDWKVAKLIYFPMRSLFQQTSGQPSIYQDYWPNNMGFSKAAPNSNGSEQTMGNIMAICNIINVLMPVYSKCTDAYVL